MSVSEVERESARSVMFRVISDLERISKSNPASDDAVMNQVRAWEIKLFDTVGKNRVEYDNKVRQKRLRCEQELAKHTAAGRTVPARPNQATPSSSSTAAAAVPVPTTDGDAPSAQQYVSAPQHSLTRAPAAASYASAPTQTSSLPPVQRAPPQSAPQSSVPRPTPPIQAAAPTTTSSATPVPSSGASTAAIAKPRPGPSPTGGAGGVSTSRKLDELREPLEQCRGILRVINVFGFRRNEQQMKEEFMRIFQNTTETIKNHKSGKSSSSEVEVKVDQITRQLRELRQRLDQRFKTIRETLQLQTAEEVFELEGKPFGIMERLVDVRAGDKYQSRLKAASVLIGSEHALKRSRHVYGN